MSRPPKKHVAKGQDHRSFQHSRQSRKWQMKGKQIVDDQTAKDRGQAKCVLTLRARGYLSHQPSWIQWLFRRVIVGRDL
ncbi:hypothetical protein QG37_02685 [Candidozyma auris]|uniref:Uncharacterized protein n=1 Tax=Candidozyma auris TaxID=498019 RepID=A0A0L0P2S2_CANAR|nr:hypothetical protein QG37_02685 [[Candida] auris]